MGYLVIVDLLRGHPPRPRTDIIHQDLRHASTCPDSKLLVVGSGITGDKLALREVGLDLRQAPGLLNLADLYAVGQRARLLPLDFQVSGGPRTGLDWTFRGINYKKVESTD